ncbi:hypothetical protein DPMN_174854 [Dreissena polymorpha]|uniref:Uncharacterized protein n=1 Tax=Dreissena polymorpha TaxID=45954 RepID=A0A9D4IIZ4_DREPO|nr:hypothetical protein DPMN_174854 [Dreissena polymorpha]
MVLEGLLHNIRKEKIKQDGGAQTYLTYSFLSPKEVIHLSVETFNAADVSVELLYDLHQPFVNVKSSQNLLVLQVIVTDDYAVKDVLSCAPPSTESSLRFRHKFSTLSLSRLWMMRSMTLQGWPIRLKMR